MFGGAAPDSRGRRDYMAALTFRTLSLDAAETALEAGGIRGGDRIGTSVLVPATEAFGVTHRIQCVAAPGRLDESVAAAPARQVRQPPELRAGRRNVAGRCAAG